MIRPWNYFVIPIALLFAVAMITGNATVARAETHPEEGLYSDYLKSVGTKALDQIVSIDTRFTRRLWDVDHYREIYISSNYGTGFIYNDQGYIVCDYSLILYYPSGFVSSRKASRDHMRTPSYIRVTFADGKGYPAELVGYDFATSLAVLKVKRVKPEDLTPVRFGDSTKVQVGEPLAILAHNAGTQRAAAQVTSGIISALRTQYADLEETENIFFQVNYPYNMGNEGGILLDLDGSMVAMISSAAPYMDIAEVHFALPENAIRDAVDQIIGTGEVRRAWFGFSLLAFSEELRQAYEIPDVIEIDYLPTLPDYVLRHIENGDLKTGKNSKGQDVVFIPDKVAGMYIINVSDESPADAAGLAANDILWMFEDTIVKDIATLNNELEKYDVGDIVTVTYLRRYYEKFEVFTTDFELTSQASEDM